MTETGFIACQASLQTHGQSSFYLEVSTARQKSGMDNIRVSWAH